MDKYYAKRLPDKARIKFTYEAATGPRTIYGTVHHIQGSRVRRRIVWDDGVTVETNIGSFGRISRA